MEIAELNLISDFEAGIKCLQNNPSLISNLSSITKLPHLYSFWTFGALIIAVFATLTNIFNKIKMFIHQIRLKLLLSYQNSCPQQIFEDDDFDFEFSDYSGDDDTPSSVAESDDEQDSDDSQYHFRAAHEVFRAEGDIYNNIQGHRQVSNFTHRRRNADEVFSDEDDIYRNIQRRESNLTLRRRNGFSWSDFSAGKSVVQLWDSFGLGLDFEDDESEGEIAIWDLDRDVKLSSGRRVTAAAEKVVLTAEVNRVNGGVGFGTYDSRVDEKSPAIYAAWRPRRRNVCDGDGQKE